MKTKEIIQTNENKKYMYNENEIKNTCTMKTKEIIQTHQILNLINSYLISFANISRFPTRVLFLPSVPNIPTRNRRLYKNH